ncbi:MAG: YifB family Mg chelatase-like AAA ATPase [Lachnospiraceae bacterium]|jgi:magnesium chelatase family protein
MICKVYSAGISGIEAFRICVEADVSGGLPAFSMVGLPSSEVKEAKDRVVCAIINSGFEFPVRRITINLSPASLRKQGSGFDLPIAIAILVAAGVIRPEATEGKIFIGELSLDGKVNPVRGVLPISILAAEQGYTSIVLPAGNVFEGAVAEGVKIHSAFDLQTLVRELNNGIVKDVEHTDLEAALARSARGSRLDYLDVAGQEQAKRATMIAVAGFHNLLYIGPPGAGKSMMAERIPTIFNRMSKQECLEISKIYSIAGLLKDNSPVLERPFRAPLHSITERALMGGMGNPRPGEITLAHRGVLFLDELTEFKKSTIDELRIPMESGNVVINRASGQARFPCVFMLVAATNPCKCGYYPDRRYCRCNDIEVEKYIGKIRGPVMDRIDICVGVERVEAGSLRKAGTGLSSAQMRERILRAQDIQRRRFAGTDIHFNSRMGKKETDMFCTLNEEGKAALSRAYDRFRLSARGWYKILKVARTIADIEGMESITKDHILEAVGYRNSYVNN